MTTRSKYREEDWKMMRWDQEVHIKWMLIKTEQEWCIRIANTEELKEEIKEEDENIANYSNSL